MKLKDDLATNLKKYCSSISVLLKNVVTIEKLGPMPDRIRQMNNIVVFV